jgi:DNA-binding NtrC family response regulator
VSRDAETQSVTILVVDDAPNTRELLKRNLQSAGYEIHTAPGVQEAIELLEKTRVDLVITDQKMPHISGMKLVRHIHENLRGTGVMMLTGYATVEGAVEAMKQGAIEYIAKPFTDEELLSAVDRAILRVRFTRSAMQESIDGVHAPGGMIGTSRPMKKIFSMIEKAARTNANVLITGESGTGKELVARAIHFASERSHAPFVPVALSGVPETLVESSLFGHVKGAFTGANQNRVGFLRAAEGGTLFLDEISEISPPIQVKLLRVLQEREYQPVGSTQTRRANVRLVAATNHDLARLIESNHFREDLYFRINVFPIALPPLRERTEDIPSLVRHFAKRSAQQENRVTPEFSDEVMDLFRRHSWPGNVRELENVIQRLVILADGSRIAPPDLPEMMRFRVDPEETADPVTLEELEVRHIRKVLELTGQNKTRAAEILGIDRKTLREKLRAWDNKHRT